MDFINTALKETLPNYLANLPLPSTVAGFANLSKEDWLYLGPLLGTLFLIVVSHIVNLSIFSSGPTPPSVESGRLNHSIQLKQEKVATTEDIEDMFKGGKDKCVYCRCWKSKKFPHCDGSHNKHNKETGDNVGPLIIKK